MGNNCLENFKALILCSKLNLQLFKDSYFVGGYHNLSSSTTNNIHTEVVGQIDTSAIFDVQNPHQTKGKQLLCMGYRNWIFPRLIRRG